MSKLPEKLDDRPVRKADPDEVARYEASPETKPWFRFRHSYTEISSIGGSTHVRASETRFENGRFSSESFEGTLRPGVHDDLVQKAQNLFVAQTAFLLRQFSWFLPFHDRSPRRDE